MYCNIFRYPKDFLIIPATHNATIKPKKEEDTNFVVKAKAPTLIVPLIKPHLRLLNSALFFVFEYLCANITIDETLPIGSP